MSNEKPNPLEVFVESQKLAAAARRADEMHHLEQWKTTGNPDNLEHLLKAYEPVIARATSKYRAPALPEAAFKAELTSLAIKAFNSYDAARGTQLNTHVQNEFRKAHRFNGKYQNAAYIPPDQAKFIGPIDRARSVLQEELGRAPTHAEIAGHIGLDKIQPHIVSRIEGNRRNDIPTSTFEEDPFEQDGGRHQEVLSMLPHVLKGRDHEVFHHLYGNKRDETPMSGNKPNMGLLAQKLNISPSQLSRSHGVIIRAYREYK